MSAVDASGELQLLRSLIRDAMADLDTCPKTTTPKSSRLDWLDEWARRRVVMGDKAANALAWFSGRSLRPFGFEWCCEHLNLDAEAVRNVALNSQLRAQYLNTKEVLCVDPKPSSCDGLFEPSAKPTTRRFRGAPPKALNAHQRSTYRAPGGTSTKRPKGI